MIYILNKNISELLPTRNTLSTTILNEHYQKAQPEILSFINSTEYVTLTTDGWQNVKHQHLNSVVLVSENGAFFYDAEEADKFNAEYITDFVR